jgi:hypothetical protein
MTALNSGSMWGLRSVCAPCMRSSTDAPRGTCQLTQNNPIRPSSAIVARLCEQPSHYSMALCRLSHWVLPCCCCFRSAWPSTNAKYRRRWQLMTWRAPSQAHHST